MTDISDGIQFRRDGVDPNQWPKLSCSQGNQLALEVSDLRLDANREILFQENGQLTASGDMLFLTGGSSPEKLKILANGNIGIGTTNPIYKLALAAGDINIDDGCALRQAGRWVIGGDSNVLSIGSSDKSDGRDISFQPGFAGALTIKKDTGNVGIGTTVPGTKLEVKGNLTLDAGDSPVLYTGTGKSELNRYLALINSLDFRSASGLKAGGVLVSDTYAYANPNKNDLIVKGNVGIGTANPGTKLEVKGNLTLDAGGNPALYTGTGNSELNRYLELLNSLGFRSASGLKAGGILVSDTYAYANPSKNDLIVKGNVGIGTTNPTNKLHVVGGGPVTIENAGEADILFKDTKNDQQWQVGTNSIGWYVWDNDYRLVVKKGSGNVGIGTANPAYKLDVAGAAHASSFPTSSDVRLKKDVTQLTNVLEKLEKIRGVSFEWNELYESLGRSTGHKEIGVTAQEVEAVFPELVTTWGDEGYKAVDYGRLTGVLIEAAKVLKAENEALKQRIKALERAIEKK